MLALGALSAHALARSRTIEALVLNKSVASPSAIFSSSCLQLIHTVTSHAGLARHTSWNDNHLGALERLGQPRGSGLVAHDLAVGVDVANIGGNTCIESTPPLILHPGSHHSPGPPLMSYRDSSVTRGLSFISSDSGWPMPPAAPSTVTLESCSTRLCQSIDSRDPEENKCQLNGALSVLKCAYIPGRGRKGTALCGGQNLASCLRCEHCDVMGIWRGSVDERRASRSQWRRVVVVVVRRRRR